jgi:hypothetical protein
LLSLFQRLPRHFRAGLSHVTASRFEFWWNFGGLGPAAQWGILFLVRTIKPLFYQQVSALYFMAKFIRHPVIHQKFTGL